MTRNYIEIVKNRYAGTTGNVPLVFNKDTRLYNCDESSESDEQEEQTTRYEI